TSNYRDRHSCKTRAGLHLAALFCEILRAARASASLPPIFLPLVWPRRISAKAVSLARPGPPGSLSGAPSIVPLIGATKTAPAVGARQTGSGQRAPCSERRIRRK